MSENLSNANEEVKNVNKGLAAPEPKVINTYINMVPISDVSGSQQPLDAAQAAAGQPTDFARTIPTSSFPMSAMNLEQLQQFMAKMQLGDPKSQLNVLGTSATTGLDAPAAAGVGAVTSNSLIPPVGVLDPNVLASLGLNVQKPTLQPIQFPNMQAGVPNLCGMQGQDLNLAVWMQKQKIALALSQMQQDQSRLNTSHKGLTENTDGTSNKLLNSANNTQSNGCNIAAGTAVPSAAYNQLTPQLAAFLGNQNLIPTYKGATGGAATGSSEAPGVTHGFGQIGGAIGAEANMKLLENVTSNLMQQSISGDMSNFDSMMKQYQEKYINNQLSAAAQLLRQHGIQATVDSNYHGGNSQSSNKKPRILQRIVASKINQNIFVVPNALTFEECDNIIDLIKDRLEVSKISISRKNGEMDVESKEEKDYADGDFCKSATACIKPEETNLIKEIESRLGLLVDSNIQHMEPMLVHKYSINDYIKEHHDGDNRTHTIAVFLSDVDTGGELDFPYAGIKVKPKKGLAVVWPNIDSQGKLDYTTVHAVNKITETCDETFDSNLSSYLLYLHINKEPVRLQYEASLAIKQVVSSDRDVIDHPKVINQVSYRPSNIEKENNGDKCE